MKLWTLAVAFSAAAATAHGRIQMPADTTQLTIGFYFVVPCDSPNASRPMQLRATLARYCVDPAAILDQTDIASLALDKDAPEPAIKLTLKPAAAARVRQMTEKRIGSELGQVVNRRLVSVARIGPTVDATSITGISQSDAASIVDAFQRGAVLPGAPPALPMPDRDSSQPNSRGIYRIGKGVSMPRLIRKEEPRYTEKARAARIEGTVFLALTVRADGIPDDIRVIRSLDPDLDKNAIEAVRKWRFQPAKRDGVSVPVEAKIEVSFRFPGPPK